MIGAERTKLVDAISKLTDEQMEIPGACELWSVKEHPELVVN